MEIEKGKAAKYLKQTHPVPKEVTEQLKYFQNQKKHCSVL